ncbi:MAG: TIGR03757 family integrating conjugative element protein [Gammaproteobacteria bacterium]|nr:TIGR03757 family integrating conjugative element protein [Gammaproteobacteria bacterium]
MPIQSGRPQATALLIIAILYLDVGSALAGEDSMIEAFTVSGIPIAKAFEAGRDSRTVYVYEIDGIESIERDLSIDMPADPEKSKRIALDRIQHMDDQSKATMRMVAQGLAKAMQYGVDRYPAIVFDGQAVVYGVTDVQTALAHYRVWRREDKR